MDSTRRAALRDALAGLAAVVGSELPDDAVDDEHARWSVYDDALGRLDTRPALLRLVGLEPDPTIATSIVLRAIEDLDEAAQEQWVRALPADEQGLARWRMREVGIARSLAGHGADPDQVDVDEWSDWLQRRVSQESARVGVLDALALAGRTRRTRAAASTRAARERKRAPS